MATSVLCPMAALSPTTPHSTVISKLTCLGFSYRRILLRLFLQWALIAFLLSAALSTDESAATRLAVRFFHRRRLNYVSQKTICREFSLSISIESLSNVYNRVADSIDWFILPMVRLYTTNGPENVHRTYNGQFHSAHLPTHIIIKILKETQMQTSLNLHLDVRVDKSSNPISYQPKCFIQTHKISVLL
uniref:Uncharacterized protein n=1 Tax=Schizaphis graminum TaxID=13262 RepID=A0A2S2NQN1_SCHGA